MLPSSGISRGIVAVAATTLLNLADAAPSTNANPPCRFLPSDPYWPRPNDWKRLNESVGGRLIAGKPLAHVCHGADYDAAACADLQQGWTEPPR